MLSFSLPSWRFLGLLVALHFGFGPGSVSAQAVFPFRVKQEAGVVADARDFAPVGAALVELLKTEDADAFALAMSPSLADLKPVIAFYALSEKPRMAPPHLDEKLGEKRERLVASARRLLARTAELGIDFRRMQLDCRVKDASSDSGRNYLELLPESHWLEARQRLEVSVQARAEGNDAQAGEYRVAITDLIAFPTAWRIDGALSWAAMPEAMTDERTRTEMKLSKAAANYESLAGTDDPALGRLAEHVVKLLRDRDVPVFERAATKSPEEEWDLFCRRSSGQNRTRVADDFAKWHEEKAADNRAAVDRLLAVLTGAGVDLGAADIRVSEVRVANLQVRSATDPLLGLEGNKLRIVLQVAGGGATRKGRPIAGEYVLAAGEIVRDQDSWWMEKPLIWEKLPTGLVEDSVASEIALEAHVNQHGTLPVGTPAPDIEFVGIHDGQKGRLADLRGKVVILDFWSTTCGPCQEPLAKMQKYFEENPRWKDRVAVVTLSIDGTLEQARTHLERRGWTKTFNVWAGEGAWKSEPAKAFRVTAIPTSYVIDVDGKIAAEDPSYRDAPGLVNRLLK